MWYNSEDQISNGSVIELSRSALKHNVKFIRKYICKKTPMTFILKGNAYGHGLKEYVRMLMAEDIFFFSVFSASEAKIIYENFKQHWSQLRLIIMGDIYDDDIAWVIKNNIEFYVFDFHRLKVAQAFAKQLQIPAKVHIEVETGMNRFGFDLKDLESVIDYLREHEAYFSVEGLCTHYAGAESMANHSRVKMQMKVFQNAQAIFKQKSLKPKLVHGACSAVAVRFPKSKGDLVRIGILQYGFWPSEETLIRYLAENKCDENPLRPVLSWKARIMSLKNVKRGEYIGYGHSYLASEDKSIATIGIGYSDGYPRGLSNIGRCLIKGHFVPVIGTINMNAITLDVTHLLRSTIQVAIGDEVILIGKSQSIETSIKNEVSVSSFAKFSEQLNYEVLARLPEHIPRVPVD